MDSLAGTITEHLPHLRRFARGLTGRQASGDAYVATTLEALIADPAIFPRELSPRAGLYRLLLSLWGSVPVNGHGEVLMTEEHAAAERHLDGLAPRPRQAFMLVAMEGFSSQDAAAIMNVAPSAFPSLLEEAARDIAAQVATDILIIEDEPLIALDLELIVQGIGHRVTGIARTKRESLTAVRQRKPGLILADIQLADGSSGIDAAHEILAIAEVPIIFITAYPEQLLTGKRPEPTFLIPKPFNPDEVKAVVSQALFFDMKAHSKINRDVS